ncbi:MAG: hypothetical protein IJH79_11940 [Lentisphaeria bacterium]|nr:hypothetical protein [Lentisphaeria bacterium]
MMNNKSPEPSKVIAETAALCGEPFFVSIVPVRNRTPEQVAAEIEEQHRLSGLKNFAVIFPLQPQGERPLDKAEYDAAFFRNLQAARKDLSLKVGILAQQTIGHGAKWNPNFDRGLDWQRMVRNNGETTIRFCPMDPRFQEYISTAIRLVTAENPDFLIIDDDCRLSFLPEKHLTECFCPRHTDHFNRKYGTSYTPEELRKAVDQAKPYDPVQLQFVNSGMETITEYVRLLRKAADEGRPGIPMMLCGCAVDEGRNDVWAKEMAAPGQPSILRIGNGYYLEGAPRAITNRSHTRTARQVLYSSKADLLLDEADTCPHTRYSKSARTMHLHIVSGLLKGLDGAKLWIADTFCPNPSITKPYAAVLKKHQGMYRELHRVMAKFVRRGPVVDLPAQDHAPNPAFPRMSATPAGGWAETYLSVFGLPFRWGKPGEPGVHLIAGETVDWLADAELDRILADPVLLDSEAAKRLIARGYGPKIGLTAVEPLTANSSFEEMNDGTILRQSRSPYSLLKTLPGAEVLSMLKFRPFASDQLTDVAPASIRFGKIIVTAWPVLQDIRIDLHIDRRKLLIYLLSELEPLPAQFVYDGDAGFWYGDIEGGRLMAVVNYSYDPMEECVFEFAELPKQLAQLQGDGSWKSVPFTVSGSRITVPVRLECAEIAIFKMN